MTSEHVSSRQTITREHALDRIHGRHISTFDLLGADELREGTNRAERELPAEVDVRLEQLVVAAVLATSPEQRLRAADHVQSGESS